MATVSKQDASTKLGLEHETVLGSQQVTIAADATYPHSNGRSKIDTKTPTSAPSPPQTTRFANDLLNC